MKLDYDSDLLWAELGRENGVSTPLNTNAIVDRLSFFKPMRPKLLQTGQIRHQFTPLYLYIQKIKLVCDSDLLLSQKFWSLPFIDLLSFYILLFEKDGLK